jgi:hypothetical protein
MILDILQIPNDILTGRITVMSQGNHNDGQGQASRGETYKPPTFSVLNDLASMATGAPLQNTTQAVADHRQGFDHTTGQIADSKK